MKPILFPLALALTVCTPSGAQERVVVPPRSTPGPREVQAKLISGSITVKASSGKEIIVESDGSSGRRSTRPAPPGMRRIDVPRGLDIDADDNTVNIRVDPSSHNLTVTVPTETTLHLKTMSGDITVDGVNGEIVVSTMNGHIRLNDVAGNVLASSQNGALTATVARLALNKPLSFVTFNGPIDVTLPADTKANLKMRTDHGEIFSDFDVKLTGGGPVSQPGGGNGRYRLSYDRTINATVNGGGADIEFRTYNGRITIRKK